MVSFNCKALANKKAEPRLQKAPQRPQTEEGGGVGSRDDVKMNGVRVRTVLSDNLGTQVDWLAGWQANRQ